MKFPNIIVFGITRKITVNPKGNGLTIMDSTINISLANLQDFERLFWMTSPKVVATDKNMSNIGVKVTIIASTDVILMFSV